MRPAAVVRPRTLALVAAAVSPFAAVGLAYAVATHDEGERGRALDVGARARRHEGEVATGPGVAGVCRAPVSRGRIRPVRRTPCVPVRIRWRAQAVGIGATRAVVVHRAEAQAAAGSRAARRCSNSRRRASPETLDSPRGRRSMRTTLTASLGAP